ncbi:hypothetical protein CVT24_002819 [Panaeolus cyanescens]|uniref:C2H2-type domain-containing protein n=1 Tax=Panaeolus cyanescens TaxID=181874 RepID=A0A409YRE5_9AGAR|nr:hypothetical protein CVT24_002819 [Panaeolus cyanescens]
MSSSTATSGTSPTSPTATSASGGTGTGAAGVVTGSGAGVNKRYRPAPAKTFQCRGYGECRMVFSRSEHLARHIRKHTGERPFSCHCSKQFSRLDNLRQHAQTVHADKQEQNERMMRELTSLHANMAAASKAGMGSSNTGRNAARTTQRPTNNTNNNDDDSSLNLIKQEDMPSLNIHPRPGTTSGYEGDGMIWESSTTSPNPTTSTSASNPRGSAQHSFRDYPSSNSTAAHSGQSFLASQQQQHGQSQSFLGFTSHTGGSSSSQSQSRPTTSSGTTSLPPLSAVVSASLPRDHHLHIHSSSSHSDQPFLASSSTTSAHPNGSDHPSGYSSGGGSSLSFPSTTLPTPAPSASSSARPGTSSGGLFTHLGGSSRPGTAPAFFTTTHNSGNSHSARFFRGLGSSAAGTTAPDRELPLLHSGFTPARLSSSSSSRPTSSAGREYREYVPPRSAGGYSREQRDHEWERERERERDISREREWREREYERERDRDRDRDERSTRERPHTSAGYDASPFYFSPPELVTAHSPVAANPRKRPFDHDDGPAAGERSQVFERTRPGTAGPAFGVRPGTGSGRTDRERFTSGSGAFLLSAATSRSTSGYKSRPGTSGNAAPPPPPPILTTSSSISSSGFSTSRPTTSSGLVNSAKALRLFDIDSHSPINNHNSSEYNRPTSRDGSSSQFAFTPPSLPAPPPSTHSHVSSGGPALFSRTGSSTSSAAGAGVGVESQQQRLAHQQQQRGVSPVTPSTTGPTSPRDYSASPPGQFRFAYGVGGRNVHQREWEREREYHYQQRQQQQQRQHEQQEWRGRREEYASDDDDEGDDEDRQSESPRFGFRVSGGGGRWGEGAVGQSSFASSATPRVGVVDASASSFSTTAASPSSPSSAGDVGRAVPAGTGASFSSSSAYPSTAASFAARTWGATSAAAGSGVYDDAAATAATTGKTSAAARAGSYSPLGAGSPISISPSLSPVPRSVSFAGVGPGISAGTSGSGGRSSSPAVSSPLACSATVSSSSSAAATTAAAVVVAVGPSSPLAKVAGISGVSTSASSAATASYSTAAGLRGVSDGYEYEYGGRGGGYGDGDAAATAAARYGASPSSASPTTERGSAERSSIPHSPAAYGMRVV